jgi:hypothetical protein
MNLIAFQPGPQGLGFFMPARQPANDPCSVGGRDRDILKNHGMIQ